MKTFDTSLSIFGIGYGGALFSRGREQHYKVIVKVFIFVKTILHKIYPDMSNASTNEAALARSLI